MGAMAKSRLPRNCKHCGKKIYCASVCVDCEDAIAEAEIELAEAVRLRDVVKSRYCESCWEDVIPAHIHGYHFKGYARCYRLVVIWLCWNCLQIARREKQFNDSLE